MSNLNLEHTAGHIEQHSIMVLLVDDQAIIGEAVRRAIASEKMIDFHFCSDATQALKQAIEIKPTVILQDLVMPHCDGLTLVQEYRNNPVTCNIPIIVLSAREDAKVKSNAFALGANDYLVKLPDSIELIARITYHSHAYITRLQRDKAYEALRQSQQQLLAANLELHRLSNSDGLTGIANRRHFDAHLETEWLRAARDRSEISLLMIDVDHFKDYNDSFGHVPGDEVLRRVASVLRDSANRATDLAARYGGEEFCLVLPNTGAAGALQMAENIRQAVQELAIPHAHDDVVTVSIGVASQVPEVGESSRHLVELSDESLYAAKQQGRNRVVAAKQAMPSA